MLTRIAIVLTVALAATEVLLVGKVDPQETPVGVAIAVLAALATVGVMRAGDARYALPAAEFRALPQLALAIVRDTLTVFAVLARAATGREPDDRLERVPLETGGEDARDATRRALAVSGTSAAPNSIVLDLDEERGDLLVHRLHA